ncbi:MAG: magnesium transporter CorA family protein [Chloroflexota bacterium]|nr:magnesium transporter CorA family protein [Chloroflexota bacterium]
MSAPTPADAPGRAGVRGYAWSPEGFEELRSVDEVERAYARPDAHLWIDLDEPGAELLADLAGCFRLHPLIVEDIVERNQRAKIETIGEVVHLVMFALLYAGELVAVEVDIVLGERFLLTAHDGAWDPRASQHFRSGLERPLREGPDYVLYGVVDYLVDGYFPVFDRIADEIDQLQEDVIERPSNWLVERLFQLRRDLLTIRHAVSPQREIFNQLTTRDFSLVRRGRIEYFRDVYDHLIRLTDELDSFRELVATTLDAYLSTVNNNLSEVMKRLTAATVILAGMGAVAGIFGMSEAGLALRFQEAGGFWFVSAFVVFLGALGLLYFRRIGWL